MRHVRAGEESLKSLQMRVPERKTINGQIYISFRDVFYNLLLNNLKQIDYSSMSQKMAAVTTKAMSAKHRKRIMRQLKRNTGLR